MTKPAELNNQTVVQEDVSRILHSWSVQNQVNPIPIQRAEGSWLYDYEGKAYLDFTCQMVNTNLGFQHPEVVEAIKKQADELVTIASPNHSHAVRGEAARRLLELAPAGFKKVFFTNGGADAIENAFRLARVSSGRHKILSAYRSYHGNTMGAISATGEQRRFKNEYATGHVHFFAPYLYRSMFASQTEEQECERALNYLHEVIKFECPDEIAAILLESIPGANGVLVPPAGYLKGVRELCDRYGIKLILDEVMAGFGRAGKWFAFENYDVVPDLIPFAKGVNGGYVPVGGVLIPEDISDYFDDHYFPGGLTYAAHPLALASIVANIDVMKRDKIPERAAKLGEEIVRPALERFAKEYDVVGEVRGIGLFWAIEFVKDRSTKEPVSNEQMSQLKQFCNERGLLPLVSHHRIHVAPPLIISPEDLQKGLDILEESIKNMNPKG